MADFALLESPKLISRKIVKFPRCEMLTNLESRILGPKKFAYVEKVDKNRFTRH